MSNPVLSSKRILIADDFELGRKIMRNALGEFGVTSVEEAADGLQAIEKLKAADKAGQPFDAVLSDWNMPNASGIDVVKFMRNTPALATTPFILVTAVGEQGRLEEAMKLGVTDYVVKPLTRESLEEKLKVLFGTSLKQVG